jgi:hypothetical protein
MEKVIFFVLGLLAECERAWRRKTAASSHLCSSWSHGGVSVVGRPFRWLDALLLGEHEFVFKI